MLATTQRQSTISSTHVDTSTARGDCKDLKEDGTRGQKRGQVPGDAREGGRQKQKEK